ncbi:hypothetical protein BJ878DRAFT_429992 [Calycina marina]|uniref:Protein kinase domain-containing protein n=1 Tax=Calycina marina TaxID=1763456 RepID=A0A9P7YWK6_9HELO|nr:hypothetical protein BJ878DRAFT_429992 [Calycina marina]
MEDLRSKIIGSLVLNKPDHRKFLPALALPQLLNRENVLKELQDSNFGVELVPTLLEYVLERSQKVFAILTLQRTVPKIIELYTADFDDSCLPVCIDQGRMFSCTVKNKSMPNWSHGDVHDFEERQWSFLSPVFTLEEYRHKLHDMCILPFTSRSHFEKESYFSKVYKVEIHPDHLKVPNIDSTFLAIKELRDGVNQDYNSEANNLENLSQLKHDHIIKSLGFYEKDASKCFLFPWADGGNLRDYWANTKRPTNSHGLVFWGLSQMLGLASGLDMLHNFNKNGNIRHGDLKPENILCFRKKDGKAILRIADVGLAKFNQHATRYRGYPTHTMSGTFKYEPPENDILKPRSRRYDIWSMGCIYLEYIIWLLYEISGLETFNSTKNFTRFWDHAADNGVQLHSVVQSWLHMMSKNPRCAKNTALGDLLELVENRLLIVNIHDEGFEPNPSSEVESLNEELEDIKTTGLPKIKHIPQPKDDTPDHPGYEAGLVRFNSLTRPLNADSVPVTQIARADELWSSIQDNSFAEAFIRRIGWPEIIQHYISSKICEVCCQTDLWISGRVDDLCSLEKRLLECCICAVIHRRVQVSSASHQQTVFLVRSGSSIQIQHTGETVLSLYANTKTLYPFAQLGLPQLPDPGGSIQMQLLKEWLQVCDDLHECGLKSDPELPTRVIDVKAERLFVQGKHKIFGRYLALSHCWGTINPQAVYCTRKANLHNHKEHINFKILPQTFRDALKIALKIGVQYLWIDSVCIVQDDPSDWESESKRMENVFSSAYCTLAASSARGAFDGFLRSDRARRPCAALKSTEGGLYICEAVDDFQKDVEDSVLNGRAWVLQERALSRRTIHFTNTQVYWECGEGVHCETLTKLASSNSNASSLLGDSNFPSYVSLARYKDRRIGLFEALYETYSTLSLTQVTDRLFAISGLEIRLSRAFDTIGLYGVFLCYLERSLLWRKSNQALKRIDYRGMHRVPSWSWMAYDGGVNYLDIPFQSVNWIKNVTLSTKFSIGDTATKLFSSRPLWKLLSSEGAHLEARTRRLNLGREKIMSKFFLDQTLEPSHFDSLRCVVVGIERTKNPEPSTLHYVLLVTESQDFVKLYERVGVAILQASDLGCETGQPVHII